jgi:hypothetical protein
LQTDLDLGASGAVIIKDDYVFTGGKQGPLYLLNADNLGGYQPNSNNANAVQVCCPCLSALSNFESRQVHVIANLARK